MKSNKLNLTLIMILLLFLQVLLSCKTDLIKNNNLPKPRNLDETFGKATLHFPTNGTIIIFNANDVKFYKTALYLKSGSSLEKITHTEEDFLDSGSEDSLFGSYYVDKILYNLTDPSSEVVIELTKKPDTLKGMFAFSSADKITLENFVTDEVTTIELMFLNCVSLIISLLGVFLMNKIYFEGKN